MPARVYVCDSSYLEELRKLMEYDPYLDTNLNADQLAALKKDEEANIIFARQDYQIKDGIALDLDQSKCYLYLNANNDFLEKAEKKLYKKIEGIQRADAETEAKVISAIEEEISNSETGLGSIFGGEA